MPLTTHRPGLPDAYFYEGTKTVVALPMTRGEYNDYRRWDMPAGESRSDPGYLVEYRDGGKPNDDRHEGYISWSPADVFERSYHPIGTFQDRVMKEAADLGDKLEKLGAFLNTNTFRKLPNAEQFLLHDQADAMRDYLTALNSRIARFPTTKS